LTSGFAAIADSKRFGWLARELRYRQGKGVKSRLDCWEKLGYPSTKRFVD
jgi:hypothetical protein